MQMLWYRRSKRNKEKNFRYFASKALQDLITKREENNSVMVDPTDTLGNAMGSLINMCNNFHSQNFNWAVSNLRFSVLIKKFETSTAAIFAKVRWRGELGCVRRARGSMVGYL